MPSNGLDVFLHGTQVAHLGFTQAGLVSMEYAPGVPRISRSLPNDGSRLRPATITAFFSNLLPDNDATLRDWADAFSTDRQRVSPRNPFALLRHMGYDVAGALEVLPEGETPSEKSKLTTVDTSQIARRIRRIVNDPTSGSVAREDGRVTGRFSLAGAQAKFALASFDGGQTFYEPEGAHPSTHIFKPDVQGLDEQALVEHVTLRSAANLGLPTAESEYRTFKDSKAIVSQRYDREVSANEVLRVHQEDLCQAMGLLPEKKYQADGGSTAQALIRMLREEGDRQGAETFIRSLAFSWVTANTDGHAKNYSVLYDRDGAFRLAPLYDMCSFWPFAGNPNSRSLINGRVEGEPPLAFTIGQDRIVSAITENSWVALARKSEMDPDEVLAMVRDIVDRAPDAIEAAVNESPYAKHEVLATYRERSAQQAERAAGSLSRYGPTRQVRAFAPVQAPQAPAGGPVLVHSYTKANGTLVPEHYRKARGG